MTLFVIVVFIHLVAAFGLFIGSGLEWTASSLLRRSTNSEQARAWLRVYRVSPPLSGPSLLVLILSGGYLASIIGAMKQGWIPAAFVGIALAVILGAAINVPRMRAIRSSLPEGNEPLSATMRNRLNDPILATSIRVRTMLAVGIVYLMAAKPNFGYSLDALGIAVVVGVLFSIPAWLSKPSASSV